MKSVGERIASEHPSKSFRLGFHAIPSMELLHMHVISQDFNSAALKTKKHWNSFNTAFFLPVDEVLERLERCGKVDVAGGHFNDLLKAELKCHRCERVFPTIPRLKDHIGADKSCGGAGPSYRP